MKNTDEFNPDEFNSCMLYMNLQANTELSYFEQFLQYDGFNIYTELKIRYAETHALMTRLEAFSLQYLDSLGSANDETFENSRGITDPKN